MLNDIALYILCMGIGANVQKLFIDYSKNKVDKFYIFCVFIQLIVFTFLVVR